jgi:diguanylate cyclase (GGDEF)-like protein
VIAGSLALSARRAGDLVARYGGEEFGLILPEVEPAMMLGVLRTLLNNVTTGSTAAGSSESEPVTISMGAISSIPPRDGTLTETLAIADQLLYEAKAGGRDRCVHLDMSTQRKTVVTRG